MDSRKMEQVKSKPNLVEAPGQLESALKSLSQTVGKLVKVETDLVKAYKERLKYDRANLEYMMKLMEKMDHKI